MRGRNLKLSSILGSISENGQEFSTMKGLKTMSLEQWIDGAW